MLLVVWVCCWLLLILTVPRDISTITYWVDELANNDGSLCVSRVRYRLTKPACAMISLIVEGFWRWLTLGHIIPLICDLYKHNNVLQESHFLWHLTQHKWSIVNTWNRRMRDLDMSVLNQHLHKQTHLFLQVYIIWMNLRIHAQANTCAFLLSTKYTHCKTHLYRITHLACWHQVLKPH